MTPDRATAPVAPDLAVLTRVRDALRELPDAPPAAAGPPSTADDTVPLVPLPRRRSSR